MGYGTARPLHAKPGGEGLYGRYRSYEQVNLALTTTGQVSGNLTRYMQQLKLWKAFLERVHDLSQYTENIVMRKSHASNVS